jgi:uncharacterized protein YndB with AHSA1/START domain
MNGTAGSPITHDTFMLERTFTATPEQVFSAYADDKTRVQWAPPRTDEMRYSRSEFRVHGTDEFRCGPAGDLRMSGRTVYLDIVENQRIVLAETVSSEGHIAAHSLVSWQLEPIGNATKVTVLVHVTSTVGGWMLAASHGGHSGALDNLQELLAPVV